MQVNVYEIEGGSDTTLTGSLRLEGGRIVPSKRDPVLDGILSSSIREVDTGRRLRADSDPQAFLENLQHNYRSPYCWASPPVDVKSFDGGGIDPERIASVVVFGGGRGGRG